MFCTKPNSRHKIEVLLFVPGGFVHTVLQHGMIQYVFRALNFTGIWITTDLAIVRSPGHIQPFGCP